MNNIYIGTYYEDGKEPVEYSVDEDTFNKMLSELKTKEKTMKYFQDILRQSKRGGIWEMSNG